MKTIKLSNFMGKVSIPDAYRIVAEGLTQKGDQVAKEANFDNPCPFVKVGVGGVPISRYYAVIRPIQGRKIGQWSKTKKFPTPKKKITKKQKKTKKK
jgi:hypothetical protein